VDRQHVNIQHILASLALKVTRQSVIIAKLSSYPRKNRTKKALWELDNCIICYNACILSELLERAERRQDYQRADAIKRANPASWKHVNLYGAYGFLDICDGFDLREVNLSEAARGRGAAALRSLFFDTN
jgi:hypothetical protein